MIASLTIIDYHKKKHRRQSNAQSNKSNPPGEILIKEFLKPLKLTQTRFAKHVGISRRTVNEIANGKRGITATNAIRFGKALGTTPNFWMNLQKNLGLNTVLPTAGLDQLKRITT